MGLAIANNGVRSWLAAYEWRGRGFELSPVA